LLANVASRYDRTPPCSLVSAITQCSQFFHEVQITSLEPDTTYYYQIAAANGTTASEIECFTTAREAGDSKPFSIAVLNDMGYTNAAGTMRELQNAISDGIAFAWHGGDISVSFGGEPIFYSGLSYDSLLRQRPLPKHPPFENLLTPPLPKVC